MNMLAPQRQRLVIVGDGMVGTRALEEIIARAPRAFEMTVFGAEPYGSYNRIMLSPLLAGEKRFSDIVTHDSAWYAANHIEHLSGDAIIAIDRRHRVVTGTHGTQRPYDVLLLATGSDPVVLPLPGANLPGVITFRNVADVNAMLSACRSGGRAVVIGGGLLGLEAAYGLSRNGMLVSVVHLMPSLMERQLDPLSAGLLAEDLRARGIDVLTGAHTHAIHGEDRVRCVVLADGRKLPADLVVMAVGIRPNIALAKAAGLAFGRGIQVDGRMRTSDPHIYAAGECVEYRGRVFGLVAPLNEMVRICADHITGAADSFYEPEITGTRLKVTGIEVFSAGDFVGDANTQVVVYSDIARGVHKRLVLRDDRLIGAVLYGDAQGSAWYCDLIQNGTDIGPIRDVLIFGPEIASEAAMEHAPAIDASAMRAIAAAVA